MRSIEISAKSVEEALQEGILQLGVRKDNVKVDVLSEASTGLFKILSNKPARVKLTVIQEPVELIKNFLQEILRLIGLEGQVKVVKEEEDSLHVEIRGNRMGVLIGKRGNTLNALQYLCNVVLSRNFYEQKRRVLLDVENYRVRREKSLEQLAENMAGKARRTNREVSLEPMTSQERRIIHLALKNNKDVETYSKGEEPFRKVIITPRQP
ncbi:MAG: RNA-binding cell elongation regulator Jag/EloR [Bacillota bacterium]